MTFLNTRAPSGHRICRDLRCKEMYYRTDPAPPSALVTDADDDNHVYWCASTCRSLSPEGGDVDLESCGPARDCYRAAGAPQA